MAWRYCCSRSCLAQLSAYDEIKDGASIRRAVKLQGATEGARPADHEVFIGLLLSFVGGDPITAEARFTFGITYLEDGLPYRY